ncbi:hypothetical protein Patl1_25932 [Pistacia atlantica]|uniref:Uncharacterized protein n=1 Tax=Pistacia atlantica TaxID=434234 RepID=A0ACC1AZZ5_9ROSI|nr:hypothetical protein Patl1_25932 [Pistacia atlantica]
MVGRRRPKERQTGLVTRLQCNRSHNCKKMVKQMVASVGVKEQCDRVRCNRTIELVEMRLWSVIRL